MKHSKACENATGDLCRCSCQGDLHGIALDKSKRRLGDQEEKYAGGYSYSQCIRCGDKMTILKKWEDYYCNYYCCSPCCPDAKRVPCVKERIEQSTDPQEIFELEMVMKEYLQYKAIKVHDEQKSIVEYIKKINKMEEIKHA